MNEQRKIVVTFDPMGTPTIEAQNFHGMGCADATAGLERALGGRVGTRELKPEFNEIAGEQDEHQHMTL